MIDDVNLQHTQLSWLNDPSAPEQTASRSAPDVSEVYEDNKVTIVSDENVTAAQAKALAQRVETAYAWDEGQLGWKNEGPLSKPLTVAVLSKPAFEGVTGDTTGAVAGVTTGPNLFVMPDTALAGRPTKEDVDTIAHELTHVQDFREGGNGTDTMPTYILEGRAYVDGDKYAKDASQISPYLGQLTAQDAQAVLKGFRHPGDEQKNPEFGFMGEITGALFVEFLRTRLNGKGDADAMSRLSAATTSLNTGTSYDDAFKQQFGVTLASAEQQFVQYIGSTEGNPKARLSGTLYAQ
jgi:hypothetical protein